MFDVKDKWALITGSSELFFPIENPATAFMHGIFRARDYKMRFARWKA